MTANERVVVSGSFDDLRAGDVRFLEEAAKLGPVRVLLWSDQAVRAATGSAPKFPEAERLYLLQAIRHVVAVQLVRGKFSRDALPSLPGFDAQTWAVDEKNATKAKRAFCEAHGLRYHVLTDRDLAGIPVPQPAPATPGRKKVIVTGCFDWFHSGHVRFFEEVAALGDLYVVVGHDANIRLLKGAGHPLFGQEVRRYLVGAVRHVRQALISSGTGWLDAAPEIAQIKPDIYAVNEDGDKPEKRAFCQQHRLEYVVLRRTPQAGLAQRSSTTLRGF